MSKEAKLATHFYKKTNRSGLVDQAAFHAYVHLRENVTQWHDEMWQHTAGCRRFFKACRNVTTHEIIATAKPKGDLPDMSSGKITS